MDTEEESYYTMITCIVRRGRTDAVVKKTGLTAKGMGFAFLHKIDQAIGLVP